MKIYLDIDDVIVDWHKAYAITFNRQLPTKWDTSKTMTKHLELLSKNKEFWIKLPLKNRPTFKVAGYVSARSIPVSWTKESFKRLGLSTNNIKHVKFNESKIKLLKEAKVDVFIDDKYKTFEECHQNGICCLLMDACHNQHIQTPYRVRSLNVDEIVSKYELYLRNK